MRECNEAGLEIIKSFEGLEDGDPKTTNLDPYLDPVGIWTIGWGHAIKWNGAFLRREGFKEFAHFLFPGGITIEQAEALLKADVYVACVSVSAWVRVPLTDNQFSALVSWEFNTGSLSKSTLLQELNLKHYDAVPTEMKRWVKGTIKDKKVTLAGLVRRREAEARLWASA